MSKAAQRFYFLDGLRGMSALIITFAHFCALTVGQPPLGRIHMGVDFFFVLSGFVCCYAYEQRLLEDMSWADFAKRRLVRLYPMYFLGFVFGLICTLVLCIQQHTPLMRLVEPIVAHILMLPLPYNAHLAALSVTSSPSGEAFPINLVVWALAYEIFVSLLYARFVQMLRLPVLIGVIGVLFLLYSLGAVAAGTYATASQVAHIGPAFCRVGFGFFMGVLVFRISRLDKRASWTWAPLFVAFYVLLGLPHLQAGNRYLDAVLLLVGLPLVVLLAARADVPKRLERFCSLSGEFAYPIYMLHYPVIAMAAMRVNHQHLTGWAAAGVYVEALLVLLLLSSLAMRLFDVPVRAWLGRVVLGHKPRPAAATEAAAP
jgi:peptidoglycan/LPS O-acetylase OafA/YrhL